MLHQWDKKEEKKQNKWVFRMRSYTGIRRRGKILGEKNGRIM